MPRLINDILHMDQVGSPGVEICSSNYLLSILGGDVLPVLDDMVVVTEDLADII